MVVFSMWSISCVSPADLVGHLVLELVFLLVVQVELLAQLFDEVLVVDLVLEVPVYLVFYGEVAGDRDV